MKRNTENCDVLILGGGIVGLTIAYQLLERDISSKVFIVERESRLGIHTSGRNSGVLHAGLYYEPNSLKAKVCVAGSRRLKEWMKEKKLKINSCGKLVIPTNQILDSQLDKLIIRGRSNGALVEIIDQKEINKIVPQARSFSGRAIWSPNTCVVNPIEVIQNLQNDLLEKGVKFFFNKFKWKLDFKDKNINFHNGPLISYGHLINATGLQADLIAHQFGVGMEYKLLPFKGYYWKLKKECPFSLNTNIYPVPDLNVPFLGIHFTPNYDNSEVYIGPTATPAFGRYNYSFLNGIEPLMALSNILTISKQYLLNNGGFRKYGNEQALLALPHLFFKSAQELIPSLEKGFIEPSNKVGIRSQLFNIKKNALENDFLCIEGPNSTHILNAISPAFTSSFELADLIIDNIEFS